MARIRSIKPEFWTDEKVVELSPFARLLFIGLWNFADDEGRMIYSPTRIKLQILPADSANVSELIGEIRGKSLVTVYAVDGIEYLQIVGFAKHQKVDKRQQSKYPSPPNSAESPRISTPDQGMDQGMDQGRNTLSGKPDELDGFNQFWKAWPKTKRKQGRADCFSIWKRKGFESQTPLILAHVEAMKQTDDWRKGFDPMPKTYLNGKRWDGAELDAPESGVKPWFINGWNSIVTKGSEFSLNESDFDSPPEFRAAVLKAAGITPEMVKQAEAMAK